MFLASRKSAEESETESRVHLDNIPVAIPDDPVVIPIRSGFVSVHYPLELMPPSGLSN